MPSVIVNLPPSETGIAGLVNKWVRSTKDSGNVLLAHYTVRVAGLSPLGIFKGYYRTEDERFALTAPKIHRHAQQERNN